MGCQADLLEEAKADAGPDIPKVDEIGTNTEAKLAASFNGQVHEVVKLIGHLQTKIIAAGVGRCRRPRGRIGEAVEGVASAWLDVKMCAGLPISVCPQAVVHAITQE